MNVTIVNSADSNFKFDFAAAPHQRLHLQLFDSFLYLP